MDMSKDGLKRGPGGHQELEDLCFCWFTKLGKTGTGMTEKHLIGMAAQYKGRQYFARSPTCLGTTSGKRASGVRHVDHFVFVW